MEETVDHRLAEEGSHQNRGERATIVSGSDQTLAVVELDSVEPFEREHAARRPPPIDLRNVIARLGHHVLAQLGTRGGLALELEFTRGPLLEMGDDEPRTKPLQLPAHP